MLDLLAFLLIGRLATFFLQKFPFSKLWLVGGLFAEGKFLKSLFDCDLCLGFWVFLILSIVFDAYLIQTRIDIISSILTGMVASFLVHVFAIGWQTKFGITYLEN